MTPGELTLDELAAETGVPPRTIRFYQSQGVLPKPTLRGRVAIYGPPHVERLHRVAELQDRGLQIKAIGQLLARVDRGELALGEWLGLDDQLKERWSADGPRLLSQAELATLVDDARPGRVAELLRLGLVRRQGDAFLVPNPAELTLALRLERAGVDLDLVLAASRKLRKRLGKAAEELSELFLSTKKGRASHATLLRELRPAALEATQLLFAKEMERVLREWTERGRTARLSR